MVKVDGPIDEVEGGVKIPGRMPGACVLHAYVPVFPRYIQPTRAYVTKHRSFPLHRSSPPSHLPIGGQGGGGEIRRGEGAERQGESA